MGEDPSHDPSVPASPARFAPFPTVGAPQIREGQPWVGLWGLGSHPAPLGNCGGTSGVPGRPQGPGEGFDPPHHPNLPALELRVLEVPGEGN